MKKILLLMSVALMSTLVNAQVICYVEAPSANEGNYDFTYAEGATWGVADLTNPLNSVQGTMVMVDDGTTQKTPTGECTSNGNDAEAKQYQKEHRHLSGSESDMWCSDFIKLDNDSDYVKSSQKTVTDYWTPIM